MVGQHAQGLENLAYCRRQRAGVLFHHGRLVANKGGDELEPDRVAHAGNPDLVVWPVKDHRQQILQVGGVEHLGQQAMRNPV